MKKILFAALVLILVLCSAVPCFAAEYKPGDEIKIDVSATYRYSSEPNVYDSGLGNGKYSVTTSDGVTVTVTPENPLPDGARLVVRQVTKDDAAAWKWFSDCTKDIGENILPFDIYFIDADGKEISVTGKMTVEISLPDGYGTPVACYLSTDERTTVLESKRTGNKVIFETDHNSYYVVAQKKGTGGSPQTGDNSNLTLWIALLLASVGAISVAVYGSRKKRSVRNEP